MTCKKPVTKAPQLAAILRKIFGIIKGLIALSHNTLEPDEIFMVIFVTTE